MLNMKIETKVNNENRNKNENLKLSSGEQIKKRHSGISERT